LVTYRLLHPGKEGGLPCLIQQLLAQPVGDVRFIEQPVPPLPIPVALSTVGINPGSNTRDITKPAAGAEDTSNPSVYRIYKFWDISF
jgi:hypothetical protein